MKAEIIAIGSELVSGQALDTNSQWLSRELGAVGIPVAFHTTIGDELEDHVSAFRIAADRADLVIMTGGLGPTQDDLTREALAQAAGVPLREDPALARGDRGDVRPAQPADGRAEQGPGPRSRGGRAACPTGSAPRPGSGWSSAATTFACLPGIPSEMRVMFHEQVVPRPASRKGWINRVIVHRKINLFGRGESDIEAEALDLTARGRVPEVGITAHDATISFRIRGEGPTEEEALRQTEPTAALIHERFGDLVLGEGTTDVPEAVVAQLERTGATLATAESCTGGLIAHLITAIAGRQPVLTWAEWSATPTRPRPTLLGVPTRPDRSPRRGQPGGRRGHGRGGPRPASTPTSPLSATGVAGPTGGSPEKPVGLVYLGLATPSGVETRRLDIGPEQPRDIIQRRSAKIALNWVRLALMAWPGRS